MKRIHTALLTTLLGALLLSGCERPPMESTQTGYRGTAMGAVVNPRLVGPIEAELWVSSDARDTDFTAKLVEAVRKLRVGDGLPTDVRGANARGLDVLFVANGIHGAETVGPAGLNAAVVEDLKKRSRKISTNAEIAQVGTISANSDRAIGEVIATAMEQVGKDGTITVEEAKSIAPDDVRKVLREKTFETFYGPVHFGKTGQNDFNAALVMQIQNGKLTVLAPESLKQTDLKIGVPSAR